MTVLKTATVLAFERKLDPSDGLFHAGLWETRDASWKPIELREKQVRGTISDRKTGKNADPAKLNADLKKPNLQRIDVATLPPDLDTLRLQFTLRILGDVSRPSACNDAVYQARLESVVNGYLENTGLAELARRYAHNLANGRFLWRNRLCAEAVEVKVSHLQAGRRATEWTFDALNYSLRGFDANDADLASLANTIEQGLNGGPIFLEVTAYVRMGRGQEVYPSQELSLNNDASSKTRVGQEAHPSQEPSLSNDASNKKNRKTKILYDVEKVAAMHSQKIGNALRTIDTWYPDAESLGLGPIAIEPYGSVTSRGTAYRPPQRKKADSYDFYNLFDNWLLKDKEPPLEQQHFVIATLIRGGVFGAKQD